VGQHCPFAGVEDADPERLVALEAAGVEDHDARCG
jgi:hypothetical protein